MLKKGSVLYSILFGKCPKCHEECMYVENNPFKIMTTLKLNKKCTSCGLKYLIEPSFFYGSMYVSYAVGIAFAVAAFIVSHVFFGACLLTTFFAITGTLIVFLPFIARVSRNIWINIFIHYDKEASSKYN